MSQQTAAAGTTAELSFFSLSLRLGSVVTGLIVAACVPFWFGFCLSSYLWLAELAIHFTFFYALGMLPLAAVCYFRKKWMLLLLVAVTFAASTGVIAPLYIDQSASAAGRTKTHTGKTLRAMSLNVLTGNRKYEAVLGLIDSEQPDLVLLLEVDQRWIDAMRPLESEYPTVEYRVRSDNFGVAFYSRLAAGSVAFRDFGGEVPSVVASVKSDAGLLTFVGTHPLPPSRSDYANLRNEALKGLAQFAAKQADPLLVMGDLNITPFSPYFHDLLARGGLRNSQRGYGYQPTWRSSPSWLALPIDHALYSNQIEVVGRRVGIDVGSDHLPLFVDFFLSR